jgi:hypothetical protein
MMKFSGIILAALLLGALALTQEGSQRRVVTKRPEANATTKRETPFGCNFRH